VFSLGSNECGQLGIGDDTLPDDWTFEPQKVNLTLIKQVSCGGDFSICVTDRGDVYSFGNNENGTLGLDGLDEYVSSPKKIEILKDVDFIECGGDYAICKTLNNEIYAWGSNEYHQFGFFDEVSGEEKNIVLGYVSPVKCLNWPDNIVNIKCGASHTLILTSNQEVYYSGVLTLENK